MNYTKYATIDDLISVQNKFAEDEKYQKYKKAILDKYDIDIDNFTDSISGGKADKSKVTDFPLDQILIGIGIELEHTTDRFKALEITLDHLYEFADYYTRLVDMEQEAEAEKEASIKQAYVSHEKGHKDSQGQDAPWVVKSHDDNKIISSHKTKEEAEKHLQDMHAHKGAVIISLDKSSHTQLETILSKIAEEWGQENVESVNVTLTPDKGVVNFKTTNQYGESPKVSPKMGP